jgi:ABC-type transport system involved in Fe-S cluster assembly fused permease/ATPase subunit
VTQANVTLAAPSSLCRQTPLRTLREALHILSCTADAYTKRKLVLALALVVAGAVLAALTPLALKLVIDGLSGTTASSTYLPPVSLLILYVAGQYLSRCFIELRMMLHGHADQRLRRRIGRRLFDHLIRMPLRFHLERKAGAMGETAEQGLRGYQTLLQHLVYTILPVAIELGVVAVVLVHAGYPFYLLVLGVSAVAYVLAFHRWASAIHEPSERVSTTHIDAHALLTDSLINAETVKYFDAEPIVSERYDAALGQTESAWRHFFCSYAANGLIVATIFALSLGMSVLFAFRDVTHGAMTVGDFVLINAYVVRLVQPLEMLGFAVRDVSQGLAFLSSMLALLRQETETDSCPTGHQPPRSRGELAFEGVSFGYRQERVVLKDVSFKVSGGQTVAVVGVSGSGKSSLIRLLFRLYEPDSGRIFIDGVPTAGMPLSEVRRAIAVVPQDTVLFHDTISKNIGFGRFGASLAEIEDAARIANLHDFIMGLPEQYETVVGERGLKLSGGERQRVAIARAAIRHPRIAVFDEATSSLDSRTEQEILRNLAALSSQCTTLVIAHRLSTVVHADQILVLSEGTIVERGTHQQLLALGGHYSALWHSQQSGAHGRGESQVSVV